MAECTQQQQHPITRQTGWPAGTPVHHLCVYVCVNDTHIHTHNHTQTGGRDGLVSTCPPCHYPGGDRGEQSERERYEEGGGRRGREGGMGGKMEEVEEGRKRRDKQKKKRDRKSRELNVTESQVKKSR